MNYRVTKSSFLNYDALHTQESTRNNLLKGQSCQHIGTSQLICSANQLTGFYTIATLALDKLIIFQNEKPLPSVI